MLKKLRKTIKGLVMRYQARNIKKTTKTRQHLRQQKCLFNGKNILVLDYIRTIAPILQRADNSIDQSKRLREIYYQYDFAGLKFYINRINKNLKRNRNGKKKF